MQMSLPLEPPQKQFYSEHIPEKMVEYPKSIFKSFTLIYIKMGALILNKL